MEARTEGLPFLYNKKVGIMSNISPLNNQVHKRLKVKTSNDFSRFKSQHLIPVLAQDFVLLATEFPLIFVKNSETEKFLPVAMMGLRNGVNLYCQDSTWSANVFPLGFSNAPFSLAKHDKKEDEAMVCIDTASNLVSDGDGEALFDDQGRQTPYLKQRAEALLKVAEFTEQITAITNLFSELDLLISKQLTVKLAVEDEPFVINGAYIIDEQKLNLLSKDAFADLRSKGLLPLIYAHLGSLHQITRLASKQNNFDLTS